MLDLDFGCLAIYIYVHLVSISEVCIRCWSWALDFERYFAIFAQVWVPRKNKWEGIYCSKFFHVETDIFAKKIVRQTLANPMFMFSGTFCPTLFSDIGLLITRQSLHIWAAGSNALGTSLLTQAHLPGWASLRNFGILSHDTKAKFRGDLFLPNLIFSLYSVLYISLLTCERCTNTINCTSREPFVVQFLQFWAIS